MVELPGVEDPSLHWALVRRGQLSPKLGDRGLYDLYWCGDRTWSTGTERNRPRAFPSYEDLVAALQEEHGTSVPADIHAGAELTRIRVFG